MKNIQRKVRLGLVAIITATTMFAPTLATAQPKAQFKPTTDIIVCWRNWCGDFFRKTVTVPTAQLEIQSNLILAAGGLSCKNPDLPCPKLLS